MLLLTVEMPWMWTFRPPMWYNFSSDMVMVMVQPGVCEAGK
jgi:hypothetical protein